MAKEQPLKIDRGSRFQYVVGVTGMSLTGLSARMHVRPGKANGGILLDMSAYVSVDAINGNVVIDMPGSATVSADWLKAKYDIKLYNASSTAVSPVRILQGEVVLDKEVTV